MATDDANTRETMLAIVSNAYGTPDVLEYKQLPKPTPLDGEVLLQVHAAGIHAGTPLIAAGIPWVMRLALGGLRAPPPDSIAGTEVAGKVVAIGSNVKTLKVGDAVFGEIVLTSRRGGFAEFVCLPETSLAIKPSNISFTKAAALPVSGQTALTAVRDAGAVKAGQKVLINGSSGGVGPYALQIAKALGAVVTAVCSTRNVEAAKALGADCVMDYATTNFTENESEKYDVVVDIAGNHPLSAVRKVMEPKGTYLSVGGSPSTFWSRMFTLMFSKIWSSQSLLMVINTPSKQLLDDLRVLVEEGKVMPQVEKTYGLAETRDAVHYVADGHARGKVVIVVVPEK